MEGLSTLWRTAPDVPPLKQILAGLWRRPLQDLGPLALQVTVRTSKGSSTVSKSSLGLSMLTGGLAYTAVCPKAPADAATCRATGRRVPGLGTCSSLATAESTATKWQDLSFLILPMGLICTICVVSSKLLHEGPALHRILS